MINRLGQPGNTIGQPKLIMNLGCPVGNYFSGKNMECYNNTMYMYYQESELGNYTGGFWLPSGQLGINTICPSLVYTTENESQNSNSIVD